MLKNILEGFYWVRIIPYHTDFRRLKSNITIGKYDGNGFWKIIGSDVSYQTFKTNDVLGHYEIKILPFKKIFNLDKKLKKDITWKKNNSEYSIDYMKNRRDEAKRNGVCTRCFKRKTEEDKTQCTECIKRDRKRSNDKVYNHKNYMKRRRKRFRKEGICDRCFKKKAEKDKNQCSVCRKENN